MCSVCRVFHILCMYCVKYVWRDNTLGCSLQRCALTLLLPAGCQVGLAEFLSSFSLADGLVYWHAHSKVFQYSGSLAWLGQTQFCRLHAIFASCLLNKQSCQGPIIGSLQRALIQPWGNIPTWAASCFPRGQSTAKPRRHAQLVR